MFSERYARNGRRVAYTVVAAILAATPTASLANVQLSFNAVIQNAPLDPCDLDPNCNMPGYPGNANPGNIPGPGDPVPSSGSDNPDPGVNRDPVP